MKHPGDQLETHQKKHHPHAKHLDVVRNLSGTVFWCCVGDCNWKSRR